MKKYEKAQISKIMFSCEDIITVSSTMAYPDITGQSVDFKSAWIENNGGSQGSDILSNY